MLRELTSTAYRITLVFSVIEVDYKGFQDVLVPLNSEIDIPSSGENFIPGSTKALILLRVQERRIFRVTDWRGSVHSRP